MGAWGHGILDNDVAGDLEAFWDLYVGHCLRTDAAFWTPQAIAELFRFTYFRGWERAQESPDPEIAWALLALASLFQRNRMRIPSEMKRAVIGAANAELGPGRLQEWDSPAQRRRILQAFIRSMGGTPKPRTSRSSPAREVTQTKRFVRRLPHWIKVIRREVSYDDKYDTAEPAFVAQLKECFSSDLWNTRPVDDGIVQARLICLAYFTGWLLELDDDAFQQLVQQAIDADPTQAYWTPGLIAATNWVRE